MFYVMGPFSIFIIGLGGLIAWKTSPLAKKWMKYSLYVGCCFATILLIPVWIFRPKSSKNALIPAAGFKAICKFLELKYSVEGEENMIRNSGTVVLFNHQSILDLIILSCLWPLYRECAVISKKELLYYQPIGLAFWLNSVIFIDRAKPDEAQETLNKTGEIIRKRNAALFICPEGTRNSGPKLLPFKKGGFRLAVASQCPIQPVAVSRFKFLGPNKFEAGEIKIRILPAISTVGCTEEDVTRLIEEVYKVMSENVDDLSK